MNRENVVERLCQMAADQANTSPDKIPPDAHLRNDVGFDSLDQAEFILAVEDAFDIDVPDEHANNVQTINDAADAILCLHETIGTAK